MARDELGSLAAFVAVAEARSFTKAAGRLGTSQSALSHTVRRLEQRLGIVLLRRTTRSVAPTEAGSRLLETLRPALEMIDAELGALTQAGDEVAGTIRITSADHAAETILWPALRQLLPRHPALTVEVNVDNAIVDIVAERYDAGIRLGRNVDKDMVAVPIGPAERLTVVASADYLARQPAPRAPDDLADHRCINRWLPSLGGIAAWRFSKDSQEVQARVSGQLACNRPELILQAALDGFGLAYLLASQVQQQVSDGRLVEVMADWCPSLPGYHLYFPTRRQRSPALRLLAEALRYRPEDPG